MTVLQDMKAIDPVVLDVRSLTELMDYLIVLSGRSPRHIQSMADQLRRKLRDQHYRLYGDEGDSASWLLLDFQDLVIHLMSPAARDEYDLETLWSAGMWAPSDKKIQPTQVETEIPGDDSS